MMNSRRPLAGILLIALLGISINAQAWSSKSVNSMHPTFEPLDESGQSVFVTQMPVDAQKTCGVCHDTDFIARHDMHRSSKVKASCIQCHFADGHMDLGAEAFDEIGYLRRDRVSIHEPAIENCGICHGVATDSSEPLGVPEDFEGHPSAENPYRDYRFTRLGGAVFSPQKISESFMNISGKEKLDFPWDAHAGKVMTCTACHYAPNNPVRAEKKDTLPSHLTNDPRRLTLSEYLRAPDHRLATAQCLSCHDPLKSHDCLPYKKRHLDKIECSACHASTRYAPTVQALDETVITANGGPRLEYRNVQRAGGEALNAALTTGYHPPLFPVLDKSGKEKISPKNIYTHWRWIDGQTGEVVSAETIQNAFMEDGKYRDGILTAFDANSDGKLSDDEIKLDSAQKTELMRARLASLGIAQPKIDGRVMAYPIAHGTMDGQSLQISCADCHAENSRLRSGVALASFEPGGVEPKLDLGQNMKSSLPLSLRKADGKFELAREHGEGGFYILGHSRNKIVERLGFWMFMATLFGVFIHGTLRFIGSRKHKAPHMPVKKVYLYSVGERALHWLIGVSVIILIISGLRVHYAGGCGSILSMARAVSVHNAFALVMMVSAFLFLFYHLASAAIRQFIPPTENLSSELMRQATYYMRGIFRGGPHPIEKSPERKLNPLQQITYLLLLNVLFPVQIVTGILIWGISRWPVLAEKIGGLSLVVPVHHMGSWLFISFLFMHLYLTTTGHTLFSNIRAMIDGYDLITDENATSGEAHAQNTQES